MTETIDFSLKSPENRPRSWIRKGYVTKVRVNSKKALEVYFNTSDEKGYSDKFILSVPEVDYKRTRTDPDSEVTDFRTLFENAMIRNKAVSDPNRKLNLLTIQLERDREFAPITLVAFRDPNKPSEEWDRYRFETNQFVHDIEKRLS